MAQYQTKSTVVEANRWTGHGSHPDDGIGEQLTDPEGNPVLDNEGNPVLRTTGKIVAPYTAPIDDDNEPVNYQCSTCGTGMAGHGVLQVGKNASQIVCPNSWIVQTGGLYEVFRNRVFNLKYQAV